MRVYLGSCSRDDLRTARQTAPSHVYGHCWRPKKRGLDTVPYFVDNGAFTGEFDSERWVALLTPSSSVVSSHVAERHHRSPMSICVLRPNRLRGTAG